jgi:hypothetical protein
MRARSLALAAVSGLLSFAAAASVLPRLVADDAVLLPESGVAYRLRQDDARVRALRIDGDAVRHRFVRVLILDGPREGVKETVPRARLALETPAAVLGICRSVALSLTVGMILGGLLFTALIACEPDPPATD